jgi:hypothetical protein
MRVAHDHKDPRLSVLGARGEARRLQQPLDEFVIDRIVPKAPTRALATDHREEIGHGSVPDPA